jgi:hypothetical protein
MHCAISLTNQKQSVVSGREFCHLLCSRAVLTGCAHLIYIDNSESKFPFKLSLFFHSSIFFVVNDVSGVFVKINRILSSKHFWKVFFIWSEVFKWTVRISRQNHMPEDSRVSTRTISFSTNHRASYYKHKRELIDQSPPLFTFSL